MSNSPTMTELVEAMERELYPRFRATRALLCRLTAEETTRESKDAASRAEYDASLKSQFESVCASREKQGLEPITMSLWLASGGE